MAVNLIYQSKPAATTLTDLYTVPAGKRANVKVFCTNQDAAVPEVWRLSIAPLGAADAVSQYLVFDEPLTITATAGCSDERSGIRLGTSDVLRVRSLNGDVSFTAVVYEESA